MKKIYFIVDPLGPIFYMEKPNDWNEYRLNIGYNDSYEMRSVYISRHQFSENFCDIKALLEKNKQKLMLEKYEEMINLMKINFGDENNAIYHDGFDAP